MSRSSNRAAAKDERQMPLDLWEAILMQLVETRREGWMTEFRMTWRVPGLNCHTMVLIDTVMLPMIG